MKRHIQNRWRNISFENPDMARKESLKDSNEARELLAYADKQITSLQKLIQEMKSDSPNGEKNKISALKGLEKLKMLASESRDILRKNVFELKDFFN